MLLCFSLNKLTKSVKFHLYNFLKQQLKSIAHKKIMRRDLVENSVYRVIVLINQPSDGITSRKWKSMSHRRITATDLVGNLACKKIAKMHRPWAGTTLRSHSTMKVKWITKSYVLYCIHVISNSSRILVVFNLMMNIYFCNVKIDYSFSVNIWCND